MMQRVDSKSKKEDNDSFDYEKYHKFINRLLEKFTEKCEKYKNIETFQLQSIQEEIAYISGLFQRIDDLILEDIEIIKDTENHTSNKFNKKSRLRIRKLESLAQSLNFAFESLLQEKPNLILARQIRVQTRREIVKYENFVSYFINVWNDLLDLPSIGKLIFDALVAFLFYIPIVGVLSYFTIFNENFILNKTAIERNEINIKRLNDKLEKEKQSLDDLSNKNEYRVPSKLSNLVVENVRPRTEEEIKKLTEQLATLKLISDENTNNYIEFIIALSSGIIGSVVSIMFRIEDFQDKKYKSPLIPFFLGIFKPTIGGAFGIFFLAIINSQIIVIQNISEPNINNKPQTPQSLEVLEDKNNYEIRKRKYYLIMMLAFVAGFSERIARDAIGKLENSVSDDTTLSQRLIELINIEKEKVKNESEKPSNSVTNLTQREDTSPAPSPITEEGQ